MWQCPDCSRIFKSIHQSHTCSSVAEGELFLGKPDELVLAYAAILEGIEHLEPCTIGTAKNTIVLTSNKAWLIIRPMKTQLDIKFYLPEELDSPFIHKITPWNNKFAHHIRVSYPEELAAEIFEMLERGHAFSLR